LTWRHDDVIVVRMDITPYIERLRADLVSAAEASGPEARELAERLGYALDSSARLAMMEAISHAAAEITSEMAAGGVDVRLDGRDLEFVVDQAPAGPPAPPTPPSPPSPPSPEEVDDGNVARITLRLPESVKARAEEFAARSGHSLNTWLVTVVRAATRDDAAISANVDLDLSSIRMLGDQLSDMFGNKRGERRMTGWL
jgi:hypothetical protein